MQSFLIIYGEVGINMKWSFKTRQAVMMPVLLGLGFSLLSHPAKADQDISGRTVEHYQTTINFERGENRKPVIIESSKELIVFQALVNNQSVWAILDNRMSDSLISAEFAQRNKLRIGPVVSPLRTPTGSLERRRAYDISLNIPGQFNTISPFSVVDLDYLSKVIGIKVDLVLGESYFQNLAFFINRDRRTIETGPSGTMRLPSSATTINLVNLRPQVRVSIAGHEVLLTVDLGYNGSLALSDKAWSLLGLDNVQYSTGRSANLQGDEGTVRHVVLSRVKTGDLNLYNVDATRQPVLQEDGDGLLGLGFFKRNPFAIDLKQQKIWVLPIIEESH